MTADTVEIGPASGPDVVLEVKQNGSSPAPTKSDKRHEEYQYLDLIQDIMEQGEHRPDR